MALSSSLPSSLSTYPAAKISKPPKMTISCKLLCPENWLVVVDVMIMLVARPVRSDPVLLYYGGWRSAWNDADRMLREALHKKYIRLTPPKGPSKNISASRSSWTKVLRAMGLARMGMLIWSSAIPRYYLLHLHHLGVVCMAECGSASGLRRGSS